jgi:hypothetical protein
MWNGKCLSNGNDFPRPIEEFKPTFAQVLVCCSPQGEIDLNWRQTAHLRQMSAYRHGTNRLVIFELLAPLTEVQLNRVRGDEDAYDLALRPALMREATRAL